MRVSGMCTWGLALLAAGLAAGGARAGREPLTVRAALFENRAPVFERLAPVAPVRLQGAPGMEGYAGLEAALRGLGAEVPDFERGELEALAVDWQAKIMSGELIGAGLNSVLGKLSVVLGVEGFNALVERYNYGNGGTGQ